MPMPKPRRHDRPAPDAVARRRPRAGGAAAAPGPVPAGRRRPASRTPTATYHHGDLRHALLAATESLLTESGLERFTLREVARRAGVSHGAPAHHFGDVRGLLSEFSADSFRQLAEAMQRRRARSPAAAYEQLMAAGAGYVEFALAHRARFQLMFRSDRLDRSLGALQDAGGAAYAQLVDCIDAITTESGAPAALATAKIALAWSIVHGFATLMIDNDGFATQIAGGDPARALALLRTLLVLNRPAFEARTA